MATTYKAARAHGPAVPPGVGDGQALKAASVVFDLGAALVVNDVIEGPTLQRGSTVLDVILVATDLDTGGSPAIALDVGPTSNPDAFIDGSTVGQAGGVARGASAPVTLTGNEPINVTVATGPATGATTGKISLTVLFLPPNS
ncbi:hypothetical protein N5K27_22455 [Pigmentiphaga sp. GD03639]|uniref:hypothetical protein n=1 Tax=Pigmentiphaga sp. GD03639 TaxID=2975354 RepID=UPI00244B0034|nr:hypothetical protein [Pigmentiphaga sp. GD03639]MDH2239074.1 hypothetical protein [Pigmentiphaga sp. GD03639]